MRCKNGVEMKVAIGLCTCGLFVLNEVNGQANKFLKHLYYTCINFIMFKKRRLYSVIV